MFTPTIPPQLLSLKQGIHLPPFSFTSFWPKFLTFLKIILALAISLFSASFISGMFSEVSYTLDTTTTIAYMVLAYFLGNLHHLSQNKSNTLFITSLLLSFLVPFIPGSIFLLLILPIFKLFKLI